ncbi:ArsR/SmtB family transcription factor [Chitinimonas sp.]|uniref:ArsR/SmtB family transcription factor n=1 Tax=Chitinimonas sp. TaxID=1934313 RepID=UPI0035B28026
MDKLAALRSFEALASEARLDVYLMLVAAGRAGLVAGELASGLDMAPSNLSFHLKNLSQADLVLVEQEGRFLRYRANLPRMAQIAGFLADHCCGGQPEQCAELSGEPGSGGCCQ